MQNFACAGHAPIQLHAAARSSPPTRQSVQATALANITAGWPAARTLARGPDVHEGVVGRALQDQGSCFAAVAAPDAAQGTHCGRKLTDHVRDRLHPGQGLQHAAR